MTFDENYKGKVKHVLVDTNGDMDLKDIRRAMLDYMNAHDIKHSYTEVREEGELYYGI